MSLSSRESGVSRWQMARSAADRMGLTAAKAGRKSYPAPLAHCRALSTMGSWINRSPVMARVNPAGRGLGAGAAAAGNDAPGWLARGWGAPVAVSYTHLRAH